MNVALVLAGGAGARMNHAVPKQYLPLEGVPIVVRTLQAFQACPQIDAICLACAAPYKAHAQQLIDAYGLDKVRYLAPAGGDRRLTSKYALDAVAPDCAPDDIVLIHDAVRPFVTERIITDNIRLARRFGAVYTVFPTQDTIVESQNAQTLDSVPPRHTLFLGQTPQSFRFAVIEKAHRVYEQAADPPPVTDDCTLALAMGHPVHLAQGSKTNIKITTPEDLEIAHFFAKKFYFAK